MVIYLAPFVCLIGLIVYALSGHAKVCELARLAYFAGLLVTLLELAQHVVVRIP